jgi:alkylation response protein AidB-like acyl-CoA dehydrogenase
VFEGDRPRLDRRGVPETRLCYVPAERCSIVDTWTTTGLRASGSHDYVVDDAFVPAEQTFNPLTSPILRDGPLYAMRTMYMANIVGVPLGIARAAVGALIDLAGTKATQAGTGLRDEVLVQAAVARAEGPVGSARGFVFDVMGNLWDTLSQGEPLSPRQRARYRLCLASASEMCVEAVELMYRAGGGASLYATNPLDRYLRDIRTLHQHIVFSPKVFEVAGRVLLGLQPNAPGF